MSGKSIQTFEWGQIEWIHEPDPSKSSSIMNIGMVTIFPNKRQNRHIHYGNEQMIYIISGEGIQQIGESTSFIKPGLVYHIEAGSVHETINQGDEPIRELLISIPVYSEQNLLIQNKNETCKDKVKISNEVDYIYDAIINPLKMPVSIMDMDGNVVIQGKDYCEFCISTCSAHKTVENCSMYKIKSEYVPPYYTDLSAYVCPYGFTVFVVPIIVNNSIIGIVKGGHIKTSSNSSFEKYDFVNESELSESFGTMQIVPKGTLNAVLQQIKKLVKTIEDYYIFKITQIELSKKEKEIRDIIKNETALQESLKLTKEKVLNIQINNHFLFNTLNAIAGLAIKENSIKTYNSIIDLSKMLRYTVTNQSYYVQLKDEIQYIQNYINLIKLRFGEKLKVSFDISRDIENRGIPFNCLQPIVENCFIHGFENMKKDMKIGISGRMDKNNLVIEITDNGIGMNQEELIDLRNRIKDYGKEKLNGLTMIYSKLELLYGNHFDFDIESSRDKGTSVKLVVFEQLNQPSSF